jgi:hypothetical protein
MNYRYFFAGKITTNDLIITFFEGTVTTNEIINTFFQGTVTSNELINTFFGGGQVMSIEIIIIFLGWPVTSREIIVTFISNDAHLWPWPLGDPLHPVAKFSLTATLLTSYHCCVGHKNTCDPST